MASLSQQKINSNLVPSLEGMALIKTAIALWNKDDIYFISELVIRKLYQTYIFLGERNDWKSLECKVSEKIQQLTQPQRIKDKISRYIKPIGLEILELIKYHLDLYDDCIKKSHFKIEKKNYEEEVIAALINPDQLYWTPQGTINRKKTAQALIRDELIDIKKRFLLACHYCLEKDIFELWNIISKGFEIHTFNKYYGQIYLVQQWTSYVKGEVILSDSYENLIYDSIVLANLEATKYFFAKINTNQKHTFPINVDRAMRHYTGYNKNEFAVALFLLSQLDDDQETEVIQKNAKFFLCSLLKWPWQPLFVQVATRVCNFLGIHESGIVLNEITDLVIKGYRDYDYHVLFGEFWRRIPNAHKRYVVEKNYHHHSTVLEKLLLIKDLENFYLILKEATAEECIKIICKTQYSDIIERIYKEEDLHSDAFIRQIFILSPSKDVALFAKQFRECILCSRAEEEIEKDKETWNKLFEFVDDYLSGNSKRFFDEEEESGVAKKLRVE